MTDYTAPLRQMTFILDHVVNQSDVYETERFADADPEMVQQILVEAGRYISEVVAPINYECDRIGAQLVNGQVIMPPPLVDAWKGYVELGFPAITCPESHGGMGLPQTAFAPLQDMVSAGSLSFVQTPMLSLCAVEAIEQHASDEIKALYLPRMASGEWTGTMNLTEPQAGSDLGSVRTRAIPQDNGRYAIKGQKIYITSGDHDLAHNIVHLVLARIEGAPEGSRGLSLFLVPKYRVEDNGKFGAFNDVKCISLEEKMGLHASSTCTMAYGEDGACEGILIGEENRGLACMFTMMNAARLHVGLQAIGCAERAFQMALVYAQERVQGRPVGHDAKGAAILHHPDIRRTLMTMRARITAARSICYLNAKALDLAQAGPDAQSRAEWQAMADALTPLSKAYGTDTGVEVASDAVQIFGGMGFIEETGIAQIYRDVRITPIYEGTNGIQAWDLANRKLLANDGADFDALLARIATDLDGQDFGNQMTVAVCAARDALAATRQAADWLRRCHATGQKRDAAAGATPFLRLVAETTGGWLLLKGARAASAQLADGKQDAFLDTQVALARHYCERLLPVSTALAISVLTGSEAIFAGDPEALAS